LTQVLLKFQYLTTKKKIKNLKQNIEELYFELGEVEEKLDEAQEDLILFNTINMKKRNGV
jgi:hypothetical protein